MKTFNVDEGTFTLKPDALLFASNGRGLARGLPEQMTIPISEIVNVQELPSSDGAELVLTLVKDDYRFKVSYPNSSEVQAGKFLDALQKQPDRALDRKNAKVFVSALLGCFGLLCVLAMIGSFVTPEQVPEPATIAVKAPVDNEPVFVPPAPKISEPVEEATGEAVVKKSDFGDEWPLKVPEVTVGCDGPRDAPVLVLGYIDPKTGLRELFALNGYARDQGKTAIYESGIVLSDGMGGHKSVQPLFEKAESTCK